MTAVATPDDLRVYLSLPDLDTDRATLILEMAEALCVSIVSPLPDGAKAIVLAVAARAFVNPTQAQDQTAGPFRAVFPTAAGGLYLSRSDKTALRRLAGTGLAFSIDMLPRGVDAAQLVTVAATGGTFTLMFGGATTGPLAYDSSAAALQAALVELPPIGAGNVTVTGSFLVAFTGGLATTPLPTLVADGANLAGTVTVTVVRAGVYAPGQNLPPWDFSRTVG